VGDDGLDDRFVDLLDTTFIASSPIAARLLTLLEERGWKGWTRIERVPARQDATDADLGERDSLEAVHGVGGGP
jgi:hypothetical protein